MDQLLANDHRDTAAQAPHLAMADDMANTILKQVTNIQFQNEVLYTMIEKIINHRKNEIAIRSHDIELLEHSLLGLPNLDGPPAPVKSETYSSMDRISS